MSDVLNLQEAAHSYRGKIQLTIMADPIRNRVQVSFLYRANGTSDVYLADFSDIKFRKMTDYFAPRDNETDHIPVSADLLEVATDQLIYASGMRGKCEMSKTERDAYKTHIADLQATNDRLMKMIEANQ